MKTYDLATPKERLAVGEFRHIAGFLNLPDALILRLFDASRSADVGAVIFFPQIGEVARRLALACQNAGWLRSVGDGKFVVVAKIPGLSLSTGSVDDGAADVFECAPHV